MKEHGGSLFKINAITVRSYSFGENDRIVTLFSDGLGMVQAVAKGARKIKSHLLSATVPFSEGSYLLYKGRSLYTITQFDFKKAYKNIANNISNLICAEYMVELSLKAGSEYHDRRLYQLFQKGLTCLEKEYSEPELLCWAFSLNVMKINGVSPNFDYCTECGVLINDAVWFSAEAGGVLCDRCRRTHIDSFKIDRATLSACRYIERQGFEFLNRLSLSKKTGNEINRIVKSCISYYISPDIKTADLLNVYTNAPTKEMGNEGEE
ncbi:MAG: DNA repair protein RecO [Thermoanaerobacteraceae bacterium]|nr:DNA repair protein RecO [Thermoanaerobacteraceae bacterium]